MADDSLNLLVRLQSENTTAKDLKQVHSDMQAIEKEMQKLTQVALGVKIDPAISAETAKSRIASLKGEYDKLSKSAENVAKETKAALGDDAKSPLSKLNMEARIKALNELSEGFNKIAGGLVSLGKGAIDEAVKIGKFEAIIKSAAKSSNEAAGALKFLNTYAMSAQPFKMESVYAAGASLVKLKQNVQDLLPKIADLASAFKKDIGETADVVGRAMAGNYRSLRILEFQYGINRQTLIEYGAELKKNGQINMAAKESQEALVAAMGKYAGKASEAANGYGAAFTRLNNEISNLKVQVGKDLIPVITDMVHVLTGGVKAVAGLGIEFKSLLSSTILIGGGIAYLGSTFMGAMTKAAAFKTAMVELNVTMGASIGIFAGVAVAAGILGNTLINEWARINALRADKIIDESKKAAQAFKQAKDAIEQGTKNPATLSFDLDKDTLNKQIEDIKSKIANAKDLQVMDTSNPNYFRDLDLQRDKLKQYYEAGKIGAKEYEERLKGINDKEKKTLENLDLANPLQAEYRKELEKSLGVLTETANLQEGSWGKTIAKLKEATEAIKNFNKEKPKETINDADFNKKIQYYKDDIDHLRKYKQEYALTYTQIAEVDKAINTAKKQQQEERSKKEEEVLKKQTDGYNEFQKTQKLALTKEEITEKQYYENLKKYMDSHAAELKNNVDLRYSYEMEYYAGVKAIAKKEKEEKEKAAEEAAKAEGKAERERIEQAQKAAEEAAKIEKERIEKRDSAEKDIQNKIDGIRNNAFQSELKRIKDQAAEYEKAGASRVKIEQLTNAELKKLAKENFEDFKKQEEDKRREIKETQDKLKGIEEDIKKAQEDLKNQQNSGFLSNGMMSAEEALSGKKDGLTQSERDMKKYKDLQDAQNKVNDLQKQKEDLLKTEKKQQEELAKIQENKNELQKSFNNLLGDAAALVEKEKTAQEGFNAALREAIALKEKYNGLGGGGNNPAPGGAPGSPENPAGDGTPGGSSPGGGSGGKNFNYTGSTRGEFQRSGAEEGGEERTGRRTTGGAGNTGLDNEFAPGNFGSMGALNGLGNSDKFNEAIADYSKNILGGMVQGITNTISNITNQNTTSSSVYKTSTSNYFLGSGSNQSRITPDPVINQQANQLSDSLARKTQRRI